jgi:hypothetical protein
MHIGQWFQAPLAPTALEDPEKMLLLLQGELISFHTERYEAGAGRKHHRIEVKGTRNYIPMPSQFEYYLYVND